jgi:hypothetical protein
MSNRFACLLICQLWPVAQYLVADRIVVSRRIPLNASLSGRCEAPAFKAENQQIWLKCGQKRHGLGGK